MKSKVLAALLSVVVLAVNPASLRGQSTSFSGALLNHDIMMPYDFASLSQTQVFGTSRAMAMGGAFTSLGGDISSVTINPAGLGMFTSEVFSMTPMVSVANSSTTGHSSWMGDNKNSFGFSNIGATFNLSQRSSGSLISLTGAITYNRLADYNSQLSFTSFDEYNASSGALVPSMIDLFGMQLADASLYPSADGTMEYANDPRYWSAQAAYDTYLIDPTSSGDGWTSNALGYNASVAGSYNVEQRGRADEYSFAIGGNIANMLYFGATLGLQEINQTTQYTYQEEYSYEGGAAYASAADQSSDSPLDSQAQYSSLWQETRLSGGGMNLKLGLTARPTRYLRIGVAYHSPTYYSLSRTYQTSMSSYLFSVAGSSTAVSGSKYSESPQFIDSYEYSWNFRTPSKLLAGASFQVGNVGVISLDYERVWYNWIRVTNAPGDLTTYDYKVEFSDYYQPTNTFRAGIEVKPVPFISLRAGGGLSSSMFKDESLHFSSALPTESHYITCGVGISISPVMCLDLAYQFHHQDYTQYRLYYVSDSAGAILSSDLFDSSLNRNYICATLTFRL